MNVICIKSCFMKDGTYRSNRHRLFTKGKKYWLRTYSVNNGYRVRDDDNDEHWIYKPGDKFFDKYFVKDKPII